MNIYSGEFVREQEITVRAKRDIDYGECVSDTIGEACRRRAISAHLVDHLHTELEESMWMGLDVVAHELRVRVCLMKRPQVGHQHGRLERSEITQQPRKRRRSVSGETNHVHWWRVLRQ